MKEERKKERELDEEEEEEEEFFCFERCSIFHIGDTIGKRLPHWSNNTHTHTQHFYIFTKTPQK